MPICGRPTIVLGGASNNDADFFTVAEAEALGLPYENQLPFALWDGPDRPNAGITSTIPPEWATAGKNADGPMYDMWQSMTTSTWCTWEWMAPLTVQKLWCKKYSPPYTCDIDVDYWDGLGWVQCGKARRAAWDAAPPEKVYARINLKPGTFSNKFRIRLSNCFTPGNFAIRGIQATTVGAEPTTRVSLPSHSYMSSLSTSSTFTVSTNYFGGGAAALKDGTDWYWQSSGYTGEWAECDFGSSKTVTHMELFSQYGNVYQQQMKIQYWNGSAWVDVCYYFRSSASSRVVFTTPIVTQKMRLFYLSTPVSFANSILLSEWQIFGS
jgi:hypothetical protein